MWIETPARLRKLHNVNPFTDAVAHRGKLNIEILNALFGEHTTRAQQQSTWRPTSHTRHEADIRSRHDYKALYAKEKQPIAYSSANSLNLLLDIIHDNTLNPSLINHQRQQTIMTRRINPIKISGRI